MIGCLNTFKTGLQISHHLKSPMLYANGNALMPRMKEFIQHLENMPANPIETIYTRATDVNGHNMRHLRLTGMLPSKNATDLTLDRVYRRYFGATDWKYNDCEGKPFLKFRYNPKYPLN
jgi:hypothetical protein